jgi:hypothetical protein
MIEMSASASDIGDKLEVVRKKIVAAMKVGMGEAMEGLAAHAAGMAPVRTGNLVAAIMRSPQVRQAGGDIIGTVSGDVGKKHVALWQEKGIKVPEVRKLMVIGNQEFIRQHRAFDVAGRPFMNPALETYRDQITAIIAENVRGALAG